MIPRHRGKVEGGKLRLDNKDAFTSWMQTLEGRRVELVIQRERHVRSDNQNRYYRGVVLQLIADHTGHTTDEVHEAMRLQFLLRPSDRGLPTTVASTTDLTTAEFSQYVENVKRWAATDLGVYCPDPGETE